MNKRQAELQMIVKRRLTARGFAREADTLELVLACTEAAEEVVKKVAGSPEPGTRKKG